MFVTFRQLRNPTTVMITKILPEIFESYDKRLVGVGSTFDLCTLF